MEQAIFVTKSENLKYANKKYSRLYFGNEFCQRLIPSLEEIKAVTGFTLKNSMSLTMVTPYVTGEGIGALMPIFEFMSGEFPETEIVVNDWGVLRLLRNKFNRLNLALGRLLTKQKRGPRILNLKKMVPEETLRHFQRSNADVPILSEFLINNGIKRIELDNLLQGISRESPGLKASLYFPFAYVTTTRFCLTALACAGKKFSRSIHACGKDCQRFTFDLRHKNMPVDLILKGNTQFFINAQLPENLAGLNIDRLVFQPEIPL